MSRIGYLKGTDLEALDQLALRGEELIPLGSDKNGYSKNLFDITRFDRIDLVLTRFFRLKQLAQRYGSSATVADALMRCQEAGVEVMIVTGPRSRESTKEIIETQGVEDNVKVVTTGEIVDEVENVLDRTTKRTKRNNYEYNSAKSGYGA